MSGESRGHRRLERFNFDSESYSLAGGNVVTFVIILVVMLVAMGHEARKTGTILPRENVRAFPSNEFAPLTLLTARNDDTIEDRSIKSV